MKYVIAALAGCSLLASGALAAERKSPNDVSISEIIHETQEVPDADGVHLVWWLPTEYWVAALSQDKTTDQSTIDLVTSALDPFTVLIVVQGDVSQFGAISFYDRNWIENNLSVSFEDRRGHVVEMDPVTQGGEDAQMLLSQLKPVLAGALGNLGKSMEIFMFDNPSKGGTRISPYEDGQLIVKLKDKSGNGISADFELPLNSLFVPRTCANGREAHISWDYCPWDGSKLPN